MKRAFAIPLAVLLLTSAVLPAAESDQHKPVDFNRDIRPLLSNTCFKCHGPDEEERQGGLRFDTPEGALGESDSGHAIVPGEPDESLLIERITSDDEDERMPPVDSGLKLKPGEIELLRRWIAEGAKWKGHWSFELPVRAALPKVSDASQVNNAIDTFVQHRLEADRLAASPEATRYELIRRVSLDLTGLPPTIEQADAFAADDRPDAYERLVDRLLASPAYGERWGRVWLDLARYADSAGYAQDPERTIWRYRDWVIQAINANKPFDEFTIEQLAGDMLENPTDDQIIATAFHRNTMTNSEGGTNDEEFRSAAVVDRVNTTMQVWMGVTMGCAQCHTHKYDPITHEEYYKFYAVFNNSEDADRGNESPVFATLTVEQVQQREKLQREIEALEKVVVEKLASTDDGEKPPATGPLKTKFIRVENPGKGVFLHLAEVEAFVGDKNIATSGTASQISTDYNGPAKLAIDGKSDGIYTSGSVSHTAAGNDPWWEVDLGEAQVLDRIVLWNRTDGGVAERLKNFRVIALNERREPVWVRTTAPTPNPKIEFALPATAEKLSDADRAEVVRYATGEGAGTNLPEQKQLAALQKQLENIKGVPTPIMRELPKNRPTHIHLRGSYNNLGPEVQPGVPAAWVQLPNGAAANRLSIAKWLVDEKNPLTARVIVNRYWELMFGIGLVETSEDFGMQGEMPSHPLLLDWLAVEFMWHDWDVKWLLKTIVMSHTYRQSSRVPKELAESDPYNRRLARGPRFRQSAETVRDHALSVAGLLSTKMYGESVRPPRPNLGLRAAFGGSTDWQASPGEDRYRRGLYTSWRRTTPYPSFMTFDATSREVCTIRRVRTNTPLQALVTLNDPVYIEAAQALARRIVNEGGETLEHRLTHGFRLGLTRPPHEEELQRLAKLYNDLLETYRESPEEAKQMATNPIGPLPDGMDHAEMAAWTVIGNVLLNLDETLARR